MAVAVDPVAAAVGVAVSVVVLELEALGLEVLGLEVLGLEVGGLAVGDAEPLAVEVAESVAALVGLLGAAVGVDVGAGAVDVGVDDVDGVAEPEDVPAEGLGGEVDDDEPEGDEPEGDEPAGEPAVPVGVSVGVLVDVLDGGVLDCGLEGSGLGEDWAAGGNVCEVIVLSGSRPGPVPVACGSATSDVNEVCVTPVDAEVPVPLAPAGDLPAAAAAAAAAAAEAAGCVAGRVPTGFAGAESADVPAGWLEPATAPRPSTAAAAHRPTTPTELSSTPFDGAVRGGSRMPTRWNAPDAPDLARAWRAPLRTRRTLSPPASGSGSGVVASSGEASPGVAGVLKSRIGLRSGRRGRTDPP